MFVFHSKYDEVTGDRLQFYSTHISGVFYSKQQQKGILCNLFMLIEQMPLSKVTFKRGTQ